MTDCVGEIICSANREGDEVLTTSYDLEKIGSDRLSWGLFRDRRPEIYGREYVK